jgi:hypothetical protein
MKKARKLSHWVILLLIVAAGVAPSPTTLADCLGYYCWEIRNVFNHATCRPVFRNAYCECQELEEVVIAWGSCFYISDP